MVYWKSALKGGEDVMEENTNTPLVHDFNENNNSPFLSMKLIFVLILVAVVGVGSGYFLAKSGGKLGSKDLGSVTTSSSVSKGTIVGSNDLKTFKDITEGVLQKGGIDGEGQYHLVRPGGESQTVYMTSSVVDLGLFVGKKVKVWGETNSAKKAGWLMDVGRVEVLE